jgi:two-component system, NtrC family, response regulator
MNPVLLIVDDDEEIRSQMRWALMQDYEVVMAEDRSSAVDAARDRQPPVVLLDLGLPPNPGNPGEGMAALSEIVAAVPLVKVIIVSGQGERANALEAVSAGAYDFLAKPVEMADLKIIIRRAFYVAQLEAENRAMQRQLQPVEGFEGMLGNSPRMQEVFSAIRKVAPSEAPVLILGESGTGKEVAARAVHRRSPRRDGAFIAINCGAIPENLLESELFGHEKGAFTGAHAQRKGRFELAAAGTLFLDEIGELPLPLQVKLLRFLQERQIERVGGRAPIEIDARVLAATNKDLRREMEQGRFREDLFYRLAVVTVRLPALREREGDVRYLAQAFLTKFSAEAGREPPRFSDTALRALDRHLWPGNVRELENRVRRAVIMAEGRRVSPADLELDGVESTSVRTLKEAREEVERELLAGCLRRHNGNISRAATELGISRPTLYELMEKHGMGKHALAKAAEPGDE